MNCLEHLHQNLSILTVAICKSSPLYVETNFTICPAFISRTPVSFIGEFTSLRLNISGQLPYLLQRLYMRIAILRILNYIVF